MVIWRKRPYGILLLVFVWLVACGPKPANPADLQPPTFVPQPQSEPEPSPLPQPTQLTTTLPSPTVTALPPTNIPPTPTLPPPTPTPDPYADLTIDALTARSYGGGKLDIIDTLEENATFTRYLISYPSDGLTIYGFMNVPNEGNNFPVALVLHGYVDPADYDTIAYTRRYADALAEADAAIEQYADENGL